MGLVLVSRMEKRLEIPLFWIEPKRYVHVPTAPTKMAINMMEEWRFLT